MKDIEKAYAAGLFDGEGCISCNRRKKPTLVVTVTNTDKRVPEYFANRWNGSIISEINQNYKPMYRWKIYGKNARPFLEDMKPYCIVKSDLITLALQFIDTIYHLKDKGVPRKRIQIITAINKQLHPLLIN